MDCSISKNDTTPIVVVVPGLTSDSASAVSSLLLFHLLVIMHQVFSNDSLCRSGIHVSH